MYRTGKTPEAISVVLTQTVVRGGAEVPATAPSSFYYRRRARSVDRRGKEKPGAGPGSLSARHTAADRLRGQDQPRAPYPRGAPSPRTADHPDPKKGAVRPPRMALRLQIRWISCAVLHRAGPLSRHLAQRQCL